MKLLLLLLLTVTMVSAQLRRTGTVFVAGRLLCRGEAMVHRKVELYERDIFSDDRLNTTFTNDNGFFVLTGQDTEFRHIEPYIVVEHNCSSDNTDLVFEQDINRHWVHYGEVPPLPRVEEAKLHGLFSHPLIFTAHMLAGGMGRYMSEQMEMLNRRQDLFTFDSFGVTLIIDLLDRTSF